MMKFSEAIRLGALTTEQIFEGQSSSENDRVVGTCALGAAEYALGKEAYLRYLSAPLLCMALECHCPDCGGQSRNLMTMIIHLNDGHRWTRNQIADWVETVEGVFDAIDSETEVVVEAVSVENAGAHAAPLCAAD